MTDVYDFEHDYQQETSQELLERINFSVQGEELRQLAEEARPSLESRERAAIAANSATPKDVLWSLVEAEEELMDMHDPHFTEEVPEPVLEVLLNVASNRSADAEVRSKVLEVAAYRDGGLAHTLMESPKLTQMEVERTLAYPQGVLAQLSARQWAGICEKRGDERSLLLAKLLRAGRDPRKVVEEVEAILSD